MEEYILKDISQKNRNTQWNFQDAQSKLLALGVENGNTSDVEAIIASRHARKNEIKSRLELTPSDIVLDLGSGMGFIAEVIAPEVSQLHCADISENFLADCRQRLTRIHNIECQKIEYGDLSRLYSKGITKVYSTLLFIHFNFYDIYFYLLELNRCLDFGGQIYFDYNDGERFSLVEKSDSFHEHINIYKENRDHWIFGCMHMTSFGVLKNIAPQLGFRIVQNWSSINCFSQILLEKTHDVPEIGSKV